MKNYPLIPQVENHYRRWLNDVRTGAYRPYLTVRSFNSAGTCSIIWSRKTGRNHHLLSQGETRCFLYLESLSNVKNIYEQHALNPDITQDIVDELGLRHRGSAKLRSIQPYTTDFVVEYEAGSEVRWAALAYKPRNILDCANPRGRLRSMINGLRIEQTYWGRMGKPWRLTCAPEYPRVVIYNIEFFRSYQRKATFLLDQFDKSLHEEAKKVLAVSLSKDDDIEIKLSSSTWDGGKRALRLFPKCWGGKSQLAFIYFEKSDLDDDDLERGNWPDGPVFYINAYIDTSESPQPLEEIRNAVEATRDSANVSWHVNKDEPLYWFESHKKILAISIWPNKPSKEGALTTLAEFAIWLNINAFKR